MFLTQLFEDCIHYFIDGEELLSVAAMPTVEVDERCSEIQRHFAGQLRMNTSGQVSNASIYLMIGDTDAWRFPCRWIGSCRNCN